MSDLYLQGKEEGIQANRHRHHHHPFELFLARNEQKGIHLVPISIGTLTFGRHREGESVDAEIETLGIAKKKRPLDL